MKPPLFFGLIALMGAAMIWHGASQWRSGSSSKDWSEASGTVTQSYLRKQGRKHSLTYSYEAGGESLTGNRKQFGQSFNRAVRGLEGLKEGDTVSVRYCSDDPSLSTLKTGAHLNVYFFFLGGLVFAAGAGIGYLKSLRRVGTDAA